MGPVHTLTKGRHIPPRQGIGGLFQQPLFGEEVIQTDRQLLCVKSVTASFDRCAHLVYGPVATACDVSQVDSRRRLLTLPGVDECLHTQGCTIVEFLGGAGFFGHNAAGADGEDEAFR